MSQRRMGRTPFVLLVVALLAATTLCVLFVNTAIAVSSLQADEQRDRNDARSADIERLQREVVSRSTPDSLAAAARAAGLVPAGTAGYLVIGPDGTAILRGLPVPAPAPVDASRPAGD